MSQKNPHSIIEKPRFYCHTCCYGTENKKDFTKHENTKKHVDKVDQKLIKSQIAELKNRQPLHVCSQCLKEYKDKSGLWRHKKKCYVEPIPIVQNSMVTNDMVLKLMEQNHDLQKQIFELAKNQTVTNNLNSNNTTNNHFNLNVFLNETCKDALNITDFVNSLQLQVKDFETTGRLGYVEGISRIILHGLRQIDVHKRPLHCTDFKREIVYIKNNDMWEKDGPQKEGLQKAVNRVAQMNFNQLQKWQEENPDCARINTKENEEYIHLSLVALGGQTQEEDEKYMDKIVKNVLREVVIDKLTK
uniref:C2H2-type domain-containing protein n=1 Tax=viral metagenome TaxID=1070528 RepID=A0A6C0B6T7_9ZZZZ